MSYESELKGGTRDNGLSDLPNDTLSGALQSRKLTAVVIIFLALVVMATIILVFYTKSLPHSYEELYEQEEVGKNFTRSFPTNYKDESATTAVWTKYGIQLPITLEGNKHKIIDLTERDPGGIYQMIVDKSIIYLIYRDFSKREAVLSAYEVGTEASHQAEHISSIVVSREDPSRDPSGDFIPHIYAYLADGKLHVTETNYYMDYYMDNMDYSKSESHFAVYYLNEHNKLVLSHEYERTFSDGQILLREGVDQGGVYVVSSDTADNLHIQISPTQLGKNGSTHTQFMLPSGFGQVKDVVVHNGLVYVLNGQGQLTVFKDSGVLISSLHIPEAVKIRESVGTEIYVQTESGISVVDVTDSSSMNIRGGEENILPGGLIEFGEWRNSPPYAGLYVRGEDRYFYNNRIKSFYLLDNRFYTYNDREQGFATIQKIINIPKTSVGVISGGVVYAYEDGAVYQYKDWVDVRDKFSAQDYELSVLNGQVGYMAHKNCMHVNPREVVVVDMTDLQNLIFHETFQVPEGTISCNLEMSPDNRYLTTSASQDLVVFDISNPFKPEFAGVMPKFYHSSVVNDDTGDFLYSIEKDYDEVSYNLNVYDLHAAQTVVSKKKLFEHLSNGVVGFTVHKGVMYVATEGPGQTQNLLHEVDVSDLNDIKIKNRTVFEAISFYAKDGYAYLLFDDWSGTTLKVSRIEDLGKRQFLSERTASHAWVRKTAYSSPAAKLFDSGYFIFASVKGEWHFFSTSNPTNIQYLGAISVAERRIPDSFFRNRAFDKYGDLSSFPYSLNGGVAQSTQINEITEPVDSATLTVIADIPPQTSIELYLTNNGGSEWERVESGVRHTFVNSVGNDLRFKAVLSTEDSSVSPVIYHINIDY